MLAKGTKGDERTDLNTQGHFPDGEPSYAGAYVVVRFVAEVDGSPVVCMITAEALKDRYGAESTLEGALFDAFGRGRTGFQPVREQALKVNGSAAVVLHSGLFRVQALVQKQDGSRTKCLRGIGS
ncbi:MAG TPA: DUF1488 domain-containing protein [Paraburkholderia sp.]|jgi:hypothetical protein|nr:DUF1488 domain-containing protein [Paraburkholderia sp.]